MNIEFWVSVTIFLLAASFIIGVRLVHFWPLVAYSSIFIFLYMVDGIVTGPTQVLTLSPSLADLSASSSNMSDTLAISALTLGLALFLVALLGQARSTTSAAHSALGRRSNVRCEIGSRGSLLLAIAPLFVLIPFFLREIAAGSLGAYLANRQLYLNSSLLLTVGYNLVPAAGVFSLFTARKSAGVRKYSMYLLTGLYLAISFLSGSRTTVLLGLAAPIFHEGLTRRSATLSDQKRRRLVRLFAALVFVGLAYLGSEAYIVQYRGASSVTTGNFFRSQDISQFDATADVLQQDIRYRPAYEAAFVSLVPRSVWSRKPISGDVFATEIIDPQRYLETKAEITVSIVGEGYLVFGALGWISAGIILAAWIRILSFLMRYYRKFGPHAELFGLLFFYRGINLIRGDLADFVVPTVLSVIYVWIGLRVGRDPIAKTAVYAVPRAGHLENGGRRS